MEKVDVLIIGGGGACYPAALRLAESGYNIVMADPKGQLGGNCLYMGCIPSKTVREMAQLKERTERILNQEVNVSYSFIMDHKDNVQETRFLQHSNDLKSFSNLKFLGEKVILKDANHASIGSTEIEAKYIIIGTGTEPNKVNFPGSEYCITSDDIFTYKSKIRSLPSDMVIIGGGYIALEVATIYNILGSKVHVLVRSGKLLDRVEPYLVSSLINSMDKNIDIQMNSPLESVEEKDGKKIVHYSDSSGNKKEISTEMVLLATGRKPVLPEGIDKAGIKLDERGYIKVDESMKSNIANIYATGDVNGLSPYFHSAVRQSIVAANNIMANGKAVDYFDSNAVPITIFTFPPISYIGITPIAAKARGIDYIEGVYKFKNDAKAQMYDELAGEIRIFFEKGSLRAIGAWIIGIDSPSLINELGIAIANGLNARQIADYADQHPTTNEGISAAARSIL